MSVDKCNIHFSLKPTFSSSHETLQTISHYLLDHYDWLRDDLPVDSLAFELIIVR